MKQEIHNTDAPSIVWRHFANEKSYPEGSVPELLIEYSDQYFEDYCIIKNAPFMMLQTVGMRHCTPDYCLANKYQPRNVLHFIVSGEGWCNDIPVKAGDIIYFKHHIPYSFSSNPANPCHYAWITFEGAQMDAYLEHMGLVSRYKVYRSPHLSEIYAILYDLLYTSHPDVDNFLYLESAFFKLLSLSVPGNSDNENLPHAKSYSPQIQKAISYISTHYQNHDVRVRHVAEAAGVSENYFRVLFKEAVGVSIRDYIARMRLDAAILLLKNSNYNIAEIAEMTGFSDYRQFSDLFKKKKGISPSAYRKKRQK